ncbi:glycoside hydrolase family 76 protein [Proteiniphilum sp.]|uniref:glycoside hydrolase family 76 protein n=1 Tax=Proteiniphilum sp. TaxID=1926877 RepID=UPI002B1F1B94|nr:glycoside hydrolase family 76 protein [Proteiniphilum sp.]MEA4918997.1 glycoside hydrolase family 76 protein [Proteiniphilum sp.]
MKVTRKNYVRKNSVGVIGILFFSILLSCGVKTPQGKNQEFSSERKSLSERNLKRAMEITDHTIAAHFTGSGMRMARFYNPYADTRPDEVGSVWMYTSAIEAVNAILHALQAEKEHGDGTLYNTHFKRYTDQLRELYDNADYYLGTFTLTSYTQTKEWTIYGVNRGRSKGTAKVEGIENVYDDQMWLTRELLESYKLTGEENYLQKAEYLTEYVLDGWDCTIDENGNEVGGIPWGPGYVTKHSCSNGPMVSPLVWLHELYMGKNDEITHRYIDPVDRRTRKTAQMKKSDYYLIFAEKVYDWQKKHLIREDGVYSDMMGGCTPGKPELETIDGVTYRKGVICRDRVGTPLTYNSGTMLSGAADLYRATSYNRYLTDGVALSDATFSFFAKKDREVEGYYSYKIDGFNNWFNGVLMRAYVDFYPRYPEIDSYIDTFQKNLDYGYEHFLHNGFLPSNLLTGWKPDHKENNTEGMFSFSFAAEYAVLARYQLTK